MMTAYYRSERGYGERPLEPGMALPEGTVWVDLIKPNDLERAYVEAALRIELPTREEMREIEASSQLYVDSDCVFLTTPMVFKIDTPHPQQGELTFILLPKYLITVRYTEPRSFPTFVGRLRKQPELLAGAETALLGLLDAVVDRLADILELVGARIDALSARVFEAPEDSSPIPRHEHGLRVERVMKSSELHDVLSSLGRAGDLNHKVRTNLAALDRLVTFLGPVGASRFSKDHKAAMKTLGRDIRSLVEQSGFLAQEANFLLDATLGLINAEQNGIIKIFSVAAVALMPPTLVASIYGMNFQYMPELAWPIGYPLALTLMAFSGIVPLWYFRRRGWL